MPLRGFVLVTHRWLGLGASAVLAIAGATGALLLWPDLGLNRFAGPLHERLAWGRAGAWVVIVATMAAVLLELGGLWLWWKRRTFSIRLDAGWRRAIFDLHHTIGAIGLIVMLTLAVTGAALPFVSPERHADLRRVLMDLHTAREYPVVVKAIYAIGSLGFLTQGVTGLLMWWRPRLRPHATK